MAEKTMKNIIMRVRQRLIEPSMNASRARLHVKVGVKSLSNSLAHFRLVLSPVAVT